MTGPVGNKRGNKALDIWSFFLWEDGKNVCVFCKYVIILFLRCIELIRSIRELHTIDNNHRIAHFSVRTATGPLRSHLSLHHHDNWVKMCGELGIKIKSLVSQSGANENSIIDDKGYPHWPFSPENFVDTLIEFIIDDDIVSISSNVAVL